MYKYLAMVNVIAAVAWAQATPSFVVPSGCRDSCASFLISLNNDNSLSSCTSLVNSATSPFTPNGNMVNNASQEQITSALGKLCASSGDSSCNSEVLGAKIANFYSACSVELTSKPNIEVVELYDVLYALLPLRSAICAKDDNGNYCLERSKIPPPTSANDLQAVLASPSSSDPSVLFPNASTFHNNGIPFLFLNPTASSSDLCNICTRNIMNAYLSFEGSVPYGPGLTKSPLLSGQLDLYQAISKTCGNNFLGQAGVVVAAGGLSGSTLSSDAVMTFESISLTFVAVILGVVYAMSPILPAL